MSKYFNVSGSCNPKLHYMVDIRERLVEIAALITRGEYFTINRARQYGKTTTLRALYQYLKADHFVVSLDFQTQMSEAKFRNENTFSIAFAKAFVRAARAFDALLPVEMEYELATLENMILERKEELELVELFLHLSDICGASVKPVVLIIDEADSAANNQVFLDFLAQLRGYYINRDMTPTFQSVILAGVYDIKNLKRKLRPEDAHKMNSPWNIAADFKVKMDFSAADIAGMLAAYEADHHTGMDISQIAEILYEYTSGYPFLVSKLCKYLDEVIGTHISKSTPSAWSTEGVREAVKMLLMEKNTLFESMVNKLHDYPELNEIIYNLLV